MYNYHNYLHYFGILKISMYTKLILLGAIFLSCVSSASAATLYIDPPKPSLNRGDSVTLSVRLDTDEAAGECVNAVDGVISYNESISVVDVSVGQSILPVWVEQPVIDKERRQITFAGGIPNGYCGRVEGDPRLTNTLLQIVVRAPGLSVGGSGDGGAGSVIFQPETKAYLNDGFGTEASLQTLGAEITLNQIVGNEIVDDWKDVIANDNIPPEEFTISLEKDETAFNQEYYIVFNTTDKQSGISHYEVIEESKEEAKLFGFGAATAPWVKERSPYVLKDQSLSSTIRVRAVDKAGNEYVATLVPENITQKGTVWTYTLYTIFGLVFTSVVVLIFFFLHRRKRKKSNEALVTSSTDAI